MKIPFCREGGQGESQSVQVGWASEDMNLVPHCAGQSLASQPLTPSPLSSASPPPSAQVAVTLARVGHAWCQI
jgi:hypothetical protein